MKSRLPLLLVIATLLWPADSGPSALFVEDYENCIFGFDDCEKTGKYKNAEPKAVVCYFTNWSAYREVPAKYTPEDIDATLCTHINYAFGVLDEKTLTIKPSEKWDIDSKFFEQVTAAKDKGVKVLMSIGGSDDSSKSEKWSQLIRNKDARANFVKATVEFLEQYGFGGLDIAYEFPGCPRGVKKEDWIQSDNDDFNQLLTDLKAAFKDKYLLSVTASAGVKTVDRCYNMPKTCEIVDWVSMITYNYHGSSEGMTGAQDPMCGTSTALGVIDTVKHYVEVVKCPPQKLVLGVPFFAITYTMEDSQTADFGVPVTGPGEQGMYTKLPGFLAYYETCLPGTKWSKGYSNSNGDFIYHDNQFVSPPSKADLARKSCLIKHYNLKGAMLWTLDYDDFSNLCGCGKYPLLKTLNHHLRGLMVTDLNC